MRHLALALPGLVLAASAAFADTSSPTPPPSSGKPLTATATVVDEHGLDGCGYLLKLADGSLLEADLPDAFMVDGLQVQVTYLPVSRPTICMAGQTVELQAIQKAP